MRKKWFLVLMLISSIILFSNTVAIVNAQETGLQVTFTTNPTVVAPGTKGYIEVNLKNIGSGTLSNIDISIDNKDYPTITREGNWEVDIGTLEGGQSTSVFYEFKVSSSATAGLYQIIFEIDSNAGDSKQTAIIKVEDTTVLDLVSVTPTSVNIGEATTLVFNITNDRESDIYNVIFTWEDPNDLILPIGSDNQIKISSITAKNYTELPIDIMASSGISPGVYPITITMEFYDQTGTKQTLTSTVGLQISGKTTFDVVLQTSGSTSTTFAIINTGANTASSVVVSIPQQAGYSTSGSSSSSLGNLEAGDYTLASFQLSSTSSNFTNQMPSFNRSSMDGSPPNRNFSMGDNMFMNQSFPDMSGNQLVVEISYTDLFGVRQTLEKQVDLNSGSASGFSSSSGNSRNFENFAGGFNGQSDSSDSSNSVMYISIGIIGIIIIVVFIQLGRKKKLARISKLFKGRKE